MVILSSHPEGETILKQIQEKQRMLKDSWLTETGHLRPGMPTGMPLAQAQARAAEIDGQIRAKMTTDKDKQR